MGVPSYFLVAPPCRDSSGGSGNSSGRDPVFDCRWHIVHRPCHHAFPVKLASHLVSDVDRRPVDPAHTGFASCFVAESTLLVLRRSRRPVPIFIEPESEDPPIHQHKSISEYAPPAPTGVDVLPPFHASLIWCHGGSPKPLINSPFGQV